MIKIVGFPPNFFLFVWFIILSPSCNQKTDKSTKVYSKMEIYCLCIQDFAAEQGNVTLNDCCILKIIHPADLITPKLLLSSTTDVKKIEALEAVFFRDENRSVQTSANEDSRLVFLFRKNQVESDTLTFRSDNQFIFNGRLRFTYPFHVIDSVKQILGIKNISCPLDREYR